MKMLTKISVLFILFSFFANSAWGAGAGYNYDVGEVNVDLHNKASLQRGAKYFVNYCLSCHSAQHSRYKRVADDLGISEDLMVENLIFTDRKFGDLMTVAMKRDDAKSWFLGVEPPDLSVKVRAIGSQAVYDFLKTFYVDDKRPFGVNNLYLPNTAMPHVLANMQGAQTAHFHLEKDADGVEHKEFDKFEMIDPGTLSEEEYDRVIVDIVNFLTYLSEPAALVRQGIGVKVLLFLAFLGVLAFFLKRNFWQDIH